MIQLSVRFLGFAEKYGSRYTRFYVDGVFYPECHTFTQGILLLSTLKVRLFRRRRRPQLPKTMVCALSKLPRHGVERTSFLPTLAQNPRLHCWSITPCPQINLTYMLTD